MVDVLQRLRSATARWARVGIAACALCVLGLSLPALAQYNQPEANGDFLFPPSYRITGTTAAGTERNYICGPAEGGCLSWMYSNDEVSWPGTPAPHNAAVSNEAAYLDWIAAAVKTTNFQIRLQQDAILWTIVQQDRCGEVSTPFFGNTSHSIVSFPPMVLDQQPANTACWKRCMVQTLSANPFTWNWYMVTADLPPEAGKTVWEQHYYTATGEVCTSPSAYAPVSDAESPNNQTAIDPSGSGATGAACVDEDNDGRDDETSQICVPVCIDTDEDGLDDTSGVPCGLDFAGTKAADLIAMGKDLVSGDATLGDLAGFHPTSLIIPNVIAQLWTPSAASCSFQFPTLTGIGSTSGGNLASSATDCTAVRNAAAPFLNFALFVVTFFIAAGAFRWAAQ